MDFESATRCFSGVWSLDFWSFVPQLDRFQNSRQKKWSERQDSNLRRLAPKASALARLSYAPNRRARNIYTSLILCKAHFAFSSRTSFDCVLSDSQRHRDGRHEQLTSHLQKDLDHLLMHSYPRN